MIELQHPQHCTLKNPWGAGPKHTIRTITGKRPVSDNNTQLARPVKKSKQSKKVTFAEKTMIATRHYSGEDLEHAWYHGRNYAQFMAECSSALYKADAVGGNVKKLDADLVCTRGLEDQIIPQILQAKRKRKKTLVRMVLRQQELFRQTGNSDPERLRDISYLLSTRSRDWAIELGTLDEANAALRRIQTP